jgi:hypothetical protein
VAEGLQGRCAVGRGGRWRRHRMGRPSEVVAAAQDESILLLSVIQLLHQGRESFHSAAAEPDIPAPLPARPPAGMEFALLESESFSPSYPTLIMV